MPESLGEFPAYLRVNGAVRRAGRAFAVLAGASGVVLLRPLPPSGFCRQPGLRDRCATYGRTQANLPSHVGAKQSLSGEPNESSLSRDSRGHEPEARTIILVNWLIAAAILRVPAELNADRGRNHFLSWIKHNFPSVLASSLISRPNNLNEQGKPRSQGSRGVRTHHRKPVVIDVPGFKLNEAIFYRSKMGDDGPGFWQLLRRGDRNL